MLFFTDIANIGSCHSIFVTTSVTYCDQILPIKKKKIFCILIYKTMCYVDIHYKNTITNCLNTHDVWYIYKVILAKTGCRI